MSREPWYGHYREAFPINIATSVEPTVEPVTQAEANAHLHLTDSSEQATVDLCMMAARQHVESYTGKRLIFQTIRQFFDEWPAHDSMPLAIGPVFSSTGTEVKWGGPGGGYTNTLSSTSYWCEHAHSPGLIGLKRGQSWPDAELRSHSGVRLTYEVGYSTSSTGVPAWAKSAVLLIGASYFANREAVIAGTIATEVPMAAKALMMAHRSPLAIV